MLDDLAKILEFESIQGRAEKDAPFGLTLKNTLDWFLERAGSYGFQTKNLDGYCGFVEYGSGDGLIGILCHLDVVPAGEGWSCPPYALTVKDGYLYGRGVVDNKGPAIVMLHVLKRMKDAGITPRHRIRLIVGCNEETGGACIQHYVTHAEIPNFSIVPDADFPVINSEKGILQLRLSLPVSQLFQERISSLTFGNRANVVPDYAKAIQANGDCIETRGRAGHAMCPEKADNAAWKLFERLGDSLPECDTVRRYLCDHNGAGLTIACSDQYSGALTLNLGAGELITTAQKTKTLDLTLDVRLPLCMTEDTVIARLQSAFLNGTIHILHRQPNLYLNPECQLIQTLLRVYQTITGENAEPQQTGGGTYARHFPYAVAFGPTFPDTETFIHDKDERISKEHVQAWLDIYYSAIQELDKLEPMSQQNANYKN